MKIDLPIYTFLLTTSFNWKEKNWNINKLNCNKKQRQQQQQQQNNAIVGDTIELLWTTKVESLYKNN